MDSSQRKRLYGVPFSKIDHTVHLSIVEMLTVRSKTLSMRCFGGEYGLPLVNFSLFSSSEVVDVLFQRHMEKQLDCGSFDAPVREIVIQGESPENDD